MNIKKNNMTYTGINIGPIVDTLSLARKPKELWAASYMFSYLMECILTEVKGLGLCIVSPAEANDNDRSVGLYPDRAYVENNDNAPISAAINKAVDKFSKTTGIGEDFVNVMSTNVEAPSDAHAIKRLNDIFARAELANRPVDNNAREKVKKLIMREDNSQDKIYGLNVKIGSLADIAKKAASDSDDNKATYRKYICIVQADGDNIGKTVENSDKTGELSKVLLTQGMEAREKIRDYGGEPIYIGGDDLLFLAPVVSKSDKSYNIFSLLKELNKSFHDKMQKFSDLPISMSFGLSITYHKYPLYEALKTTREQLFNKAKNVVGKNTIAWCLRKHSGTGFTGIISQGSQDAEDVSEKFNKLLGQKTEEKAVSAIAHKLRENIDLVGIIRKSGQANRETRLEAFYKTMLNESDSGNKEYTEGTRELLCSLFTAYPDTEKKSAELIEMMYGMLRTAKFINGEKESDEIQEESNE